MDRYYSRICMPNGSIDVCYSLNIYLHNNRIYILLGNQCFSIAPNYIRFWSNSHKWSKWVQIEFTPIRPQWPLTLWAVALQLSDCNWLNIQVRRASSISWAGVLMVSLIFNLYCGTWSSSASFDLPSRETACLPAFQRSSVPASCVWRGLFVFA